MSNVVASKQDLNKKLKRTQEFKNKYDRAGCYSISIDNKLVYIGQSTNMMNRISLHMGFIKNPKKAGSSFQQRKYKILQQAYNEGHQINFDVIYYSDNVEAQQWDLLWKESALIRKYLPPLNFNIPAPNPIKDKGYQNKTAITITLPQILQMEDTFIASAAS